MTRRCFVDSELCILADLDWEQVQDVGLSVEAGDLHGKTPFDGGEFSSQDALELVVGNPDGIPISAIKKKNNERHYIRFHRVLSMRTRDRIVHQSQVSSSRGLQATSCQLSQAIRMTETYFVEVWFESRRRVVHVVSQGDHTARAQQRVSAIDNRSVSDLAC